MRFMILVKATEDSEAGPGVDRFRDLDLPSQGEEAGR